MAPPSPIPMPFLEENLEYLTTPQLMQAASAMYALNFMITQHHPQRPSMMEREYERNLVEYKKWNENNRNNPEKLQSLRVLDLYNLVLAMHTKRQKLSKEDRKLERAREKKRVEGQGGKEKRAVVTLRNMNVVITCIDTDTLGRHSRLSRFPPS